MWYLLCGDSLPHSPPVDVHNDEEKRQFLLSETCLLKKVRVEQRNTLQYDKSYDRRIQVSYKNV